MIDLTQLPLIRLLHTNNIFKYNSILKLIELITFKIILFVYNLLHICTYVYIVIIITITLI